MAMNDLRELVDPLNRDLRDIRLLDIALECCNDLQGPVTIGDDARLETKGRLLFGGEKIIFLLDIDKRVRIHGFYLVRRMMIELENSPWATPWR
jgi:hypothetical protein